MQFYALSESERAILSVCQLDANLTHQEIGSDSGVPPYTVGRVLRRLTDEGILRRYPVVNHFAIGKFEFGLYLSTSGKVIESLRVPKDRSVRKMIGAITRLGGRNNLCVDLIIESPHQAASIVQQRLLLAADAVLEQKLVMRVARTIFQRKFFSARRPRVSSIKLLPPERASKLAPSDQRLLEILSESPDGSLALWGKEMGLSPSAVLGRRRALKATGVLAGEAYAVIALKLGLFVFRALVSVRALSGKGRQELNHFFAVSKEVVAVAECIGAWDYEVRVEAFSLAEIEAFRAKLEHLLRGNLQSLELVPFLGTTYMSAFSP